jgi:hypothetical protein
VVVVRRLVVAVVRQVEVGVGVVEVEKGLQVGVGVG